MLGQALLHDALQRGRRQRLQRRARPPQHGDRPGLGIHDPVLAHALAIVDGARNRRFEISWCPVLGDGDTTCSPSMSSCRNWSSGGATGRSRSTPAAPAVPHSYRLSRVPSRGDSTIVRRRPRRDQTMRRSGQEERSAGDSGSRGNYGGNRLVTGAVAHGGRVLPGLSGVEGRPGGTGSRLQFLRPGPGRACATTEEGPGPFSVMPSTSVADGFGGPRGVYARLVPFSLPEALREAALRDPAERTVERARLTGTRPQR